MRIPKLVLTGGPCAGKTTGLLYPAEKLMELGYHVFIIPEVATLLMEGGIHPENTGITPELFQEYILQTQIYLENTYLQVAKASTKSKKIILCDRGIMDQQAYIGKEKLTKMLHKYGHDYVKTRDERYDAVFHLVTAADGAEAYYGNVTNKVRRENLAEARDADKRTREAWTGAPHLRIIRNNGDFQNKLHRLLHEILHALGEPVPIEREYKYLIQGPVTIPDDIHYQVIDIEQTYLTSADPEATERIRKRGQEGTYIYFHTVKRYIENGTRYETEQKISKEEYERLYHRRDERYTPIHKQRICFIYEYQYFELDIITQPTSLVLMEIELTEKQQEVVLPPFITILKDVTNDHSYTNHALARK